MDPTLKQQIIAWERQADQAKAAGQPGDAIRAYQQILELDPSFTRAHLALALLLEKQGDFQTAIRHAERLVELEPQDALNHAALSVLYQRAFEATRDPAFIAMAEAAKARSR